MSSPNYKIDERSNIIHPNAIVDENVELGTNNFIGPFCYLTGYLTVGDNNRFEGFCSVGTRPEHSKHWHKDGRTVIGNGNTFREHITINGSTDEGLTRIDNGVIMLRDSHVAHDCVIEDDVTLSCDAVMLGHVHVMLASNCGSGCQIHQYQVIGSWSMIGMGCIIPKKSIIIPGHVWVGNPGKSIKVNEYRMKDVDEITLVDETKRFMMLREEHGL